MSASEGPGIGRTFLVVTFVVATIIGVAVAYFGMTGVLGGPIP